MKQRIQRIYFHWTKRWHLISKVHKCFCMAPLSEWLARWWIKSIFNNFCCLEKTKNPNVGQLRHPKSDIIIPDMVLFCNEKLLSGSLIPLLLLSADDKNSRQTANRFASNCRLQKKPKASFIKTIYFSRYGWLADLCM